ncbi:STAS-like domain-containing protein [Nostoc sp. CCY 9925]|uniref:STAS-like domain-containing protein n=1 Tax=Nostoc sp. CCY 9925 TaxID=3103865 RepID=UPI0039C738FF
MRLPWVVHISPTDVTGRKIESYWPGTLVYVTIKLGISQDINLQRMMSEFRTAATQELSEASNIEAKTNFYINVRNYFGKYAEDKMTAIRIRDEKLMPEIAEGKSLTIDFDDIISAPHSFLNALLATPIRQYGMAAYKKIKIINAAPEIRETIDFILDENTNIGE